MMKGEQVSLSAKRFLIALEDVISPENKQKPRLYPNMTLNFDIFK